MSFDNGEIGKALVQFLNATLRINPFYFKRNQVKTS